MNRLGQVLRALFWLPILLAGFAAFTFVAPSFEKLRLPSVILLALFVVVEVVQGLVDRTRNSSTSGVQTKPAAAPVTESALGTPDTSPDSQSLL